MGAEPERGDRGAVCLGNDAVIDWVIAFCASLHEHEPDLPLTLIPFDQEIGETRAVLDRYGYGLYEGPMLEQMDDLGRGYWPGEQFRPHIMRKFCSWDTYDTFLFMDTDIVVLSRLDAYFKAMGASGADFMHFATDMVQVYRPGPLRERMLAEHDSAGFNSGVFMGRRGQLTTDQLESRAAETSGLRLEFVDNLEQTFINYCIDVSDACKVDANDLVPDLAVAGALMRLVKRGTDFVLSDRRVAYSGRQVSMIHWAGYAITPLMPYRRTFLRYRLSGASRGARWRYSLKAAASLAKGMSPRFVYQVLRGVPYGLRSWLSARGLVEWRGSRG